MWSAVSSRSHHPTKIFTFGPPSNLETDVMLYGTVEYGMIAGGSDGKEWAARAVLVPGEKGDDEALGGWRMKFYQVYLDTAAKR